jgi:hypothetical protein
MDSSFFLGTPVCYTVLQSRCFFWIFGNSLLFTQLADVIHNLLVLLMSDRSLPSRTQSLKAAIVFYRDLTVKASSKNELNVQNLIKIVRFLVSTIFLVERCV